MNAIVRVTPTTLSVLRYLDSLDGASTWGFDIVSATRLKTGTVYPILDRLEGMRWISSHWEDDPNRSGPRRRFYEINAEYAEAIGKLLAANPETAKITAQTPARNLRIANPES